MAVVAVYEKLIKAGQDIEFFEYSEPVLRGYQRKKRKLKPVKKGQLNLFKDRPKPRRPFSINRARTELRRAINANTDMCRFVTLTYADHETNLKRTNRQFNNFAKRLEYKFPNIKYVAVPEFTKKGRIHYHLLVNRYIDSAVLAEIWGHGFVKINKRDPRNLGVYMSKYLSKEQSMMFYRKKKFFTSQNLNRAKELINLQCRNFMEKHMEHFECLYCKSFWSKFTGNVIFIFYQFMKPHELLEN